MIVRVIAVMRRGSELLADGFWRGGTVYPYPDAATILRVQIDRDVQGHVVYIMVANHEFMKAGKTETPFGTRMRTTFNSLKNKMGDRADRVDDGQREGIERYVSGSLDGRKDNTMNVRLTSEDIERANRVMRDPFDSDKPSFTVYPTPVANDDGLFEHRGEYVPCHACQPDPMTGEATWRHPHLVTEGSNGGIRCEPLTVFSFEVSHAVCSTQPLMARRFRLLPLSMVASLVSLLCAPREKILSICRCPSRRPLRTCLVRTPTLWTTSFRATCCSRMWTAIRDMRLTRLETRFVVTVGLDV